MTRALLVSLHRKQAGLLGRHLRALEGSLTAVPQARLLRALTRETALRRPLRPFQPQFNTARLPYDFLAAVPAHVAHDSARNSA